MGVKAFIENITLLKVGNVELNNRSSLPIERITIDDIEYSNLHDIPQYIQNLCLLYISTLDNLVIINEDYINLLSCKQMEKFFQYITNLDKQCIIATNQTNILHSRFVTPDTVYFFDLVKNEVQCYSLLEFKNIHNTTDYESGYRNGIYGGI